MFTLVTEKKDWGFDAEINLDKVIEDVREYYAEEEIGEKKLCESVLFILNKCYEEREIAQGDKITHEFLLNDEVNDVFELTATLTEDKFTGEVTSKLSVAN